MIDAWPNLFPLQRAVWVAGLLGAIAGLGVYRIAEAYRHLALQAPEVDACLLARAVRLASVRRGRPGAAVACSLLSAGTIALAVACLGTSLYAVAVCVAGLMAMLLACIDTHTGLLPDALTFPLLWMGLALSWAGYGIVLQEAVAGAILGYALLWSLRFAFLQAGGREAFGLGDAKLLAALGAWGGWRPLPFVLLLACLLGAAYVMFQQRSLRPRGAYPFGPFLIAASACAVVGGSELHSGFW